MGKRVNPIIFRLGVTSFWRSKFSNLNYIIQLKNFLIFRNYINSNLFCLNQIFSFFYYSSGISVFANISFLLNTSICFKKFFRTYRKKRWAFLQVFRLNASSFFYRVAFFFNSIKWIKYLFFIFYLKNKKVEFLRLLFFYFYKKFLLILLNSSLKVYSLNNSLSNLQKYYLHYCFIFIFFYNWFFFIQKYIRNRQKIALRRRYSGTVLRFYSRAKQNMRQVSMFARRYQVPKKYFLFKKKMDSFFFRKFMYSFIFNYFFWYKRILFRLIFRFFNYWVFIKSFYLKYFLRSYLLKRTSNLRLNFYFDNVYFFSKMFKKTFLNLPSIVRFSFTSYKIKYRNKQKLFLLFFLALLFRNIYAFNFLLSYLLPRNKNQYILLRLLDNIMFTFQFFRFNFYSIVVKISGKFSGKFVNHKAKTKTLTLVYGLGLPLQDASSSCKYSALQINTRKGIFGLKTWFYLK